MPDTKEQARAAARSHALLLLAELVRLPATPGPFQVTVEEGGVAVTVMVMPPRNGPESKAALSDCERDLLALLRGRESGLTTNKVLEELDRRGLRHGESTVKKALARLCALGVLGNSRKRGGYYVLSWTPLFPD